MNITRAFSLWAVAACAATVASAGPADDCTKPEVISLAKRAVYASIPDSQYRQHVPSSVYDSATRLGSVAPVSYDPNLRMMTCQATITANASAGLDRETDQGLQIMFARAPDVLMGLSMMFTGPANAKEFTAPIVFTHQIVGDQRLVRVTKFSELHAIVLGSVLKERAANVTTVVPPPATNPPQAAPRAQTLAPDTAKGEIAAADKELNLAYREAMNRLPEMQKVALRTAQREWIKRRDTECADDGSQGIGPGSQGALEVTACQIKLTRQRSGELQALR